MNRRTFLQQSGALAGLGLAGLAGCGRVIINCPGYGGRKLWSDESIGPVRGQIAWLILQAGANYGLFYKDLYVVARRDGIVVQPVPGGDDYGWNDANEESNRQEAEAGVLLLKELFDRMAAMRQ